jgi:hypothetical protein
LEELLHGKAISLISATIAFGGCAYQVDYEADYVADEQPSYIADAEIVVLMHPHDTEYVFQGAPTSAVGEFTTLTIPIGNIMQEITAEVFSSCFAYGVVFTESLSRDMNYLVAIEPEILDFSYQYDRAPIGSQIDQEPRFLTTPRVAFELSVKAYDSVGETVLENTYASGSVAGEPYEITSRPYERINATFHSALQDVMLRVADDIRPLLVGQCEISDVTG